MSKIKGSKSGIESHSRVCYRFRQFALSLYRVLWHAIHLLQVLQCMQYSLVAKTHVRGRFLSFPFRFPPLFFHCSFHVLPFSFHVLSFPFIFLSFPLISFHVPFISFHFFSCSFHFLSFSFRFLSFPFILLSVSLCLFVSTVICFLILVASKFLLTFLSKP